VRDAKGACTLRQFGTTSRSLTFAATLAFVASALLGALHLSYTRPIRARAEVAESPSGAVHSVNCVVDASRLTLDGEEQAVLDSTNAYRAQYGLQPLQLSWPLQRIALWKASDTALRTYMQHDDGFRSWEQRFADCGYDYIAMGALIGENLSAGYAGGGATLSGWEASPLHNANLLNPAFSVVGIKRVQSAQPGDPYGWYWAMELGSIDGGDTDVWDIAVR
jgi:uncharacterized protein YkwD